MRISKVLNRRGIRGQIVFIKLYRFLELWLPMIVSLTNAWGMDLSLFISDMRAPHLGGNKLHKLTGYIAEAKRLGLSRLVTMAGAHSNHLRAFAALARRDGFQATAIIRGDELIDPARHSPEIRFALDSGVHCVFIRREVYRSLRETTTAAERTTLVSAIDFATAQFIPEGGLGPLGVRGVADWAGAAQGFDEIWLPCATGTTAAGFLLGTQAPAQVRAVAVLENADAIQKTIRLLAPEHENRFELVTGYELGGFAKTNSTLESLCDEYSEAWGMHLDATYMGKTVMALKARAEARRLAGRILLAYTYNE